MSLAWRVVPIVRWSGEQTKSRRRDPFSHHVRAERGNGRGMERRAGVDWRKTTDLLARELRQLRAKNIVLQMAVTDADIRNDGRVRANASPAHPGVIVTFDSKHGPLSYPCDQFTDWQANVRGVALALEALRKVDRYGVTRRGEQYTGWKQLPSAGGTTTTMTAERAAEILAYESGHDSAAEILADPEMFRWCYREAAKL